jgi:putative nucleotidyltransferase with HDIG domain
MLGLNTVKNLTLSTAVLAALPANKNINGMDMESFWQHCLFVGVTAKLLAVKQGVDPALREEYFVAGLLHDIGKIPLNAVLSKDYLSIINAAGSEQKPVYIIEDKELQFNHCEAGAIIAKTWKLESAVADVIIHHHNIGGYSGEHKNILYNVAIANYFSSVYGIGCEGDKNHPRLDDKIWNASGLKDDLFEEIKEKVNNEIEKARIFLNAA